MIEADDFDPREIYNNLMDRIKQSKEWFVACYVAEEYIPVGQKLPFDVIVKDGVFICRVVCPTYTEAQNMVLEYLPVIKFIEDAE